IAVEDRRFYSHWGLDVVRVPGALWGALRRAGDFKGTSTITQQLARSMFLTPERSLRRKIKEALLAIELERRYSKEEILELYFNQVWFGGSVYGVQAAAEKYFGKNIGQLTPVECATLGAMLANPSAYSPYYHPDRLLQRRNFFLGKMKRLGCLNAEDYEAAVSLPLTVLPPGSGRNEAPYFVEVVRRYLAERYGTDFVYRSGSVVYTTLDLELQRKANEVIETGCTTIERDYKLKATKARYDSAALRDSNLPLPNYLQAALVAMETRTGYVRAFVGGRDFRRSEFDRVTQAERQAGSTFKPFVYVAAIDQGMTAADVEDDAPVSIPIAGQPDYAPHNYDGKFLGKMSLRRALALSRNVVAVKLAQRLGPQLVAQYANLMGITKKLPPYYSLALGSVEVTLMELTTALNTLANSGLRVRPILVQKVTDGRGVVLEENRPEAVRVLQPTTAYIVTSMLQSVVDEGTATAIRRVGYTGPAAGKTGTTDDYTDNWFVGYTPELTCGIWVGYDQRRPVFKGATGGVVCAPMWGEFMKAARPDSAATDSFPVPDRILSLPVCELSGKLATPTCPRVRYEVFVLGTEPRRSCPLHGRP
ncbi:MAG: PBP1A family penicillin-binding protein, partial [candidate division WOR-3 bacterium]